MNTVDQTLIDTLTKKIREQVLAELKAHASTALSASPEIPRFIAIPEGTFLAGDSKESRSLLAYQIAETPVTVRQWRVFMRDSGYAWADHGYQLSRTDREDHPITRVNVADAEAYCAWLSKKLGRRVALPSADQWEKAARGTDGRVYPWGDEAPTETLCQFNTNDTASVYAHPKGASPYGVLDLSGNVWEWTRTECEG